jgi:hypothetical protein
MLTPGHIFCTRMDHLERIVLSREQQLPHARSDDRERIIRARQAAEALFAPKPLPVIEKPLAEQPPRQPRILKSLPSPARPPAETAATPGPPAPAAITPPHVARIRAYLKYGMTIAQVAEAYRVPISEIERILGKL